MTISIATILILCLVYFVARAYSSPTTYSLIFLSVIGSAIILFFIGCVISYPVSIEINNENIILKKLSGKLIIPIKEITTIERRSNFGFDSKKFGSGGFFGFNGFFVNDAIGKYTGYVTNQNNIFWVITENKKYTFNCDEPDKFISLIKSKMNHD